MLWLNSRAQWDNFTIEIWWATIRYGIKMSLSYPSCKWYINCPFLVLRRGWGLLLWLWWFLNRGIIWSDNLLLRHFCGGLLDGKMTGRLRTNIMCTWKGNRDTKSCGDIEPLVVCRRVIWITYSNNCVNDCKAGMEGLYECSYTCKIM